MVPLPEARILSVSFQPRKAGADMTMDDVINFATAYTQKPPVLKP